MELFFYFENPQVIREKFTSKPTSREDLWFNTQTWIVKDRDLLLIMNKQQCRQFQSENPTLMGIQQCSNKEYNLIVLKTFMGQTQTTFQNFNPHKSCVTISQYNTMETLMNQKEWKNKTCEDCTFRVAIQCRRHPPGASSHGLNYYTYPIITDQGKYFGACAEWQPK